MRVSGEQIIWSDQGQALRNLSLFRHNLGMVRPSGHGPAVRPAGRPTTRKQPPATAAQPATRPHAGHPASRPPRPRANYPAIPPRPYGHGHPTTVATATHEKNLSSRGYSPIAQNGITQIYGHNITPKSILRAGHRQGLPNRK